MVLMCGSLPPPLPSLGTPIQNSLKDLWSLLSFLKLKPFTDREWWHRTIQRPVTMGDQGGLKYEILPVPFGKAWCTKNTLVAMKNTYFKVT